MPIKEIYLIHHTHVDVGYTDLQPVILENHIEFSARVLDYCTETDDYPDDARFRWVHEFSWPVVQFLRRYPEREEELAQRIREGRIEVCGLFLDPTELYDRRSFTEALRSALELGSKHGFDIAAAMTTDIPGMGWSLPDVLADNAIPYLSISPNAMVSKPLPIERPIWWIGPRGGRVLLWQTDWRKGWYGEAHILGYLEGFEQARDRTMEYLELLGSEGYPWDILLLHLAADNYPPARHLSDLVRTWNEQGDLPRLRIATNREFFERLTEVHGREFPEYRAAWPDYWAEGQGSAAYETALSRETHCRIERIEALQALLGDETDLWPVFEDLLTFDEHTWGCQSMALRPHSFQSKASWAFKVAHIYRAYDAARRLEGRLAGQLAQRVDEGPGDYRDATLHQAGPGAARVTLFNPLATEYVGPVCLPGVSATAGALKSDADPRPIQHAQETRLSASAAWSIAAVRPQASRAFTVLQSALKDPCVHADERSLENQFYRIEFDASGRVASILDRESGLNMLDITAPWSFAETIQESIQGTEDRRAIWERNTGPIPHGYRRTDAPFRREGSLGNSELLSVQSGPVFGSVTWRSSLPYVRYMETEVRLYCDIKRIDVEVRLDKQPCETYDGLYVAFPFALERPRAFIHNCDAVFEPEVEQIPGSCRDYYAAQHFAAMANAEAWAVVSPVDSMLVQLGEITFGRWADHLSINRACIYAWVANNFWYTNFPGYQLGELRFRFAITTGAGSFDADAATAFGHAARVGLTVG